MQYNRGSDRHFKSHDFADLCISCTWITSWKEAAFVLSHKLDWWEVLELAKLLSRDVLSSTCGTALATQTRLATYTAFYSFHPKLLLLTSTTTHVATEQERQHFVANIIISFNVLTLHITFINCFLVFNIYHTAKHFKWKLRTPVMFAFLPLNLCFERNGKMLISDSFGDSFPLCYQSYPCSVYSHTQFYSTS